MEFLNGRVVLHHADCFDALATLQDNSIDSCVCDPPYHLTSIVKRFGGENAAPAKFGTDGAYARASSGFMNKKWDGGDVAFRPETWAAVYRVLKPGAYLLAFGGTRTYHRMACAIEDAGFEVRDMVSWVYGSGFPKSHDVSKGIDRAAGAERKIIGKRNLHSRGKHQMQDGWHRPWMDDPNAIDRSMAETTAATDAAREWAGWGTSLKPALEPICMARKPLSEDTVAANVLRWGTGAINVDGCRVGTSKNVPASESRSDGTIGLYGNGIGPGSASGSGFDPNIGRWPANVIHDGSEEVVAAFPDRVVAGSNDKRGGCEFFHGEDRRTQESGAAPTESGSAARFFYTAKADADDRLGSKHPTVKPVDLMQYLVRLVTPKGGTTLDLFAGTGTTGEAAWREGMRAILIEREAEYCRDIERRMALVLSGPDERMRESAKARHGDKPPDHGPLFDRPYNAHDDMTRSVEECYQAIRERKANGGPGWPA